MPAIRHRAANIFAAANPDRKKLVQRYQIVNKLKGDPLRGATLFQQNCTPCHRLNDQGHSVGPDLGSLSGKSVDTFLIAILDPNQAVESRYISYNAVTKDDRDVSGVIASETPTSITLKSPGGAEEVILRSNLKELTSSGLSLMPDGLEKALDPQAMADLIAFISSNSPPKVFAGNAPLLIDPKADGTLSLLAGNCKIYGDTLVYEDHYQNLGYWQSETDRAVWALKLPRGGKYDVWFDWALPADSPNNSFCLESGESSLTARIPKTGSWDDYQQAKLGSIQLQAGRQNVELRGERPVEGALLDLREIRLVPSGQPAPADFLSVQKK
jgi:putative heme-binding domain-containing protein